MKKFKRLMLHRIKWDQVGKEDVDDDDEDDDEESSALAQTKYVHYLSWSHVLSCMMTCSHLCAGLRSIPNHYFSYTTVSSLVSRCQLVWEGAVQKAAFSEFRFERCRSEAMARKYLADRLVPHYWDQAKNHITQQQ